jgi:hypothetical protein
MVGVKSIEVCGKFTSFIGSLVVNVENRGIHDLIIFEDGFKDSRQ